MRVRRALRDRLTPLLVAVLSVVALVGTVAFAYWSSTGTGTASAPADAALAMTLTPGTPSSALYPGGSADVALTITNPNAFPVRVGVIKLETSQGTNGFAVDGGHSGCGLSELSYLAQTNAGAGWTVPPKVGGVDGTLAVSLTNAISMTTNAAAACAGGSFTVYLNDEPDYHSEILNTSGLNTYWRLGTQPLAADHFSGTAGTLLTAHTGDTGASWVQLSGESPAVLTDANRMRRDGAGSSIQYSTIAPNTTDYAVDANLYFASILAADKVGVMGRINTSNTTYYTAQYDPAGQDWYLLKVRVGGTDSLGCWCAGAAPGVGETHRVRLQMTGTSTTTLKMYIDGVLRLAVDDSSTPLTVTGRPGIQDGEFGAGGSKTNSTGIHVDDFRTVLATGTTMTDEIGSNTGTFTGSPVLNEPGAIYGDNNGGVQWVGIGSYATVPDAANLDLGNSFTLEAWLLRADNATGRQTILTKGTNGYELYIENNRLTLGKAGVSAIVQSTSQLLDMTAYHHVVATKNVGTVKLYIDGVDVTGTVTDVAIADNATALTIGATSAAAEALNGTLDDLALYDPALTAAVVSNHYRLGHGS